jgi:FlaG/FlaF family flagellin (archaellin)
MLITKAKAIVALVAVVVVLLVVIITVVRYDTAQAPAAVPAASGTAPNQSKDDDKWVNPPVVKTPIKGY